MSSLSEPTKYYIDDFNNTEALEVKLQLLLEQEIECVEDLEAWMIKE